MKNPEVRPLSDDEWRLVAEEEAKEVFAAGAWYAQVDSGDCPDADDLMLNAAAAVAALLFIEADGQQCAPESVIQALGYAVGERVRPQDGSFHAHAMAVLLEGFRQGVTGDTIGATEGVA